VSVRRGPASAGGRAGLPGPAAPRRHSGERGAAAVLVLALAGVLALLGATGSALAAVAVARQRAATVADLAALAAAQRALDGPAAACTRAAQLAAADDARLLRCTLTGDVAAVVVQVTPPGPIGRLGSATAWARAGPAAGTS
jgi:secretion/DNA translocation related TadE-like protein